MTPRWTLYSCFYDCKSFSSDAIEVRKVYTNIACNFRDGPLIWKYRMSNVKPTLCHLETVVNTQSCMKKINTVIYRETSIILPWKIPWYKFLVIPPSTSFNRFALLGCNHLFLKLAVCHSWESNEPEVTQHSRSRRGFPSFPALFHFLFNCVLLCKIIDHYSHWLRHYAAISISWPHYFALKKRKRKT